MEEQMEIEEMNQTQQPLWLVNNILFCYDSKRKQHFLQHNENHDNNQEAYTDGSKSTGRKAGFAAIYVEITRKGAQPEKASIYTAEMTAIKIAMREIEKREDMRWVIYTNLLN